MNILEEIILNKKEETKNQASDGERFKEAFSGKSANIIGEIKVTSPKYDYSNKINLKEVFQFYGCNKEVKAVSNLIDEKYFSGDIVRGRTFKQLYNKPIFFKEFVIDRKQIDGAHYYGYDALLLLARCLSNDILIELLFYTLKKGIFPIVEIDNEEDFKRVLTLSYELDFGIAVNCRNLGTMDIDRKRHFVLEKKFREKLQDKIIFAFSGIDDVNQIAEYKGKFNGVLIGSYFMERFCDRGY